MSVWGAGRGRLDENIERRCCCCFWLLFAPMLLLSLTDCKSGCVTHRRVVQLVRCPSFSLSLAPWRFPSRSEAHTRSTRATTSKRRAPRPRQYYLGVNHPTPLIRPPSLYPRQTYASGFSTMPTYTNFMLLRKKIRAAKWACYRIFLTIRLPARKSVRNKKHIENRNHCLIYFFSSRHPKNQSLSSG